MRVLRPKLRPILILTVLAVIVIGLMQWVGKRPTAKEAAPPPQRPAPLVRTTVVDPTLLVEQSSFPGEVRASATADVISRIAGRLGAVLVKEGSFIGAGSLVARIDDPELLLAVRQADAAVQVQRARLAQIKAAPRSPEVAQAEANVSQAEATVAQAEVALAQARRELARTQQLFAEGLIARAAVDRAQTDVDRAQADVELARARVRAAKEQVALVKHGPRAEDIEAQAAQVRQAEVAVAQARARLRELRITSPIAGVVTRLNVESGAVISSQTVVATVATVRPIEVHVQLPETDMSRLRQTSAVKLTVDALPERLFEGKIARMAPALDAASRSARLVVVVPNADLALRPGMFARATIVFDTRQAILISTDAIVRRGTAAIVFVVNPKDATVAERAVKVGYIEGGRSEIVEGLAAGEVIVTAGQLGLREGMKVRTSSGGPGAGQPGTGDGQGSPGAPGSPRPAPSASPGR